MSGIVTQLNEGTIVSDATSFQTLIRHIRAGDQTAAQTLVREYEPFVRREIRMRLVDHHLRRVFDSMDVCQSVWASFFVRAAAGQYDLENQENLLKLLVRITRNKLASAARHQNRLRRDHRRTMSPQTSDLASVVDQQASPSEIVSSRELLDTFFRSLSTDERSIADLRASGAGWQAIAEAMGGTAQGRRMQFSRAVDRTLLELGIDDPET